jgi:hypothetical protein
MLVPITIAAHTKHFSNLSESDQVRLRKKFRKGTRSNIQFHILNKIFKNSKKWGGLGKQIAEDLGNKKGTKYTLPMAGELVGAYLATKDIEKKLKKTAGLLSQMGSATKAIPSTMGKDFVHPLNLYNSVQGVASGQDSVGSAVGRFAGSTAGAMGLSKLLDPLINLLPGPLKWAGHAASFLGSMYAGSKAGDMGAKAMSSTPIYKRKGFDTIQEYNADENT